MTLVTENLFLIGRWKACTLFPSENGVIGLVVRNWRGLFFLERETILVNNRVDLQSKTSPKIKIELQKWTNKFNSFSEDFISCKSPNSHSNQNAANWFPIFKDPLLPEQSRTSTATTHPHHHQTFRTTRVVSHGSPATLLQSTAQTLQGLGPVNRWRLLVFNPGAGMSFAWLSFSNLLLQLSWLSGSPLPTAPHRLPTTSWSKVVLENLKAGTGTAVSRLFLQIHPRIKNTQESQKTRALVLSINQQLWQSLLL